MAGDNLHFQAEREQMGTTRHVYVHLIVFTQFGMHKSELERASLAYRVCAVCGGETRLKKKIPSLCLRVMGGTNPKGKWEYTLLFAVVCGTCKPATIKRYSLVLLKAADLARIEHFIDEQAFQGRCVEVENFLCANVYNALIDNYLWRLNVINSQVPALCRLLWDMRTCFFCHGEAVQKCEQCKCIAYCHETQCTYKHKMHHGEMCRALRCGRLFHIDPVAGDKVYHVERGAAGRCLRYKPETLEMSDEEGVDAPHK